MRTFINIIVYGCVLLFLYWIVFGGGPLRIYRHSRGRTRAQEGSQRRELVQRVQALLPQAKEDTILFSMYEKFVRYCGNNQFKVYFSGKKMMGRPEEYRVQLTADGKQISYLLNRQTCEFEMESEKCIEENFRDAH